MRPRLVPTRRLPSGQWGPLLALGIWGSLVLWVVWAVRRGATVVGLCPVKRVTGVPCPTCGGTRAALRASEGDLAGALLFNPLLCVALVVLTGVLLLRLVGGRRIVWGLTQRQQRVIWLVLLALFLANWAYVIFCVG